MYRFLGKKNISSKQFEFRQKVLLYVVYVVVLNTFKRSTAERVPSECSQPQYTCDIFLLLLYMLSKNKNKHCSYSRIILSDKNFIYNHTENKDAWRCGYAPTFDNINVCRAAWIINGYYISGLMNWAQHSDSKTLVKSKIQLLELK